MQETCSSSPPPVWLHAVSETPCLYTLEAAHDKNQASPPTVFPRHGETAKLSKNQQDAILGKLYVHAQAVLEEAALQGASV